MNTPRGLAWLFVFLSSVSVASAQDRPFLFTLVPPGPDIRPHLLHYDVAYGNQTFEPLGADDLEQLFGAQVGVAPWMTLVGRISFATDKTSTSASELAEVLLHVLNSPDGVVDFTVGPGFRHEYGRTNVLLARAIVGRRFMNWQIYGNMLLEKPLAEGRDEVDLLLTLGWTYRISRSISLGLEAVGQDLEGFWEEEEAEGGAVLFFGPTLAAMIPSTAWTFTVGAGPIIRATQSTLTSDAVRDLPMSPENGFVIHAAVNFAL